MNPNNLIADKFGLDLNAKSPIELPISRHGLAKLFCDLGYRHIAEIGTERGLFARALAKYNPEATIYCVDAWTPFKGYRDHVNRKKLEEFYQVAKHRLAPYNCKIIRQFSLDAVRDFDDETLDAVYIDADHSFQAVTNDICEWGKKVKRGGIISGHDFEIHKGPSYIHVKEVVKAYVEAYRVKPYFVTNTDEDDPETESAKTARSFMWIKGDFKVSKRSL